MSCLQRRQNTLGNRHIFHSLRIVLVLRNRCVCKLFTICWTKLKLKFITQATFVDFSWLQSNGRVPVYLVFRTCSYGKSYVGQCMKTFCFRFYTKMCLIILTMMSDTIHYGQLCFFPDGEEKHTVGCDL